jgi:hypothetical protein
MSDDYRWRSSRDRDADTLAVVAAALQSDYEAAVTVVESLGASAAGTRVRSRRATASPIRWRWCGGSG